jgi:hypothetical protein
MKNELKRLRTINKKLRAELRDYRLVFDGMWNADMRGVAIWRKKTGKHNVLPDSAALMVWVLDHLTRDPKKLIKERLSKRSRTSRRSAPRRSRPGRS